jgi:hypothetical protein
LSVEKGPANGWMGQVDSHQPQCGKHGSETAKKSEIEKRVLGGNHWLLDGCLYAVWLGVGVGVEQTNLWMMDQRGQKPP